ncbi:Leucine-rich repeat (LRR) protein [Fodinibius roseus]|uniref:Leucine-rich repeat (LRR) protein n=1 Tax=Fodinibius roseus TaxID=1194090 RepID=A0A1M4SQC9_9BACT|nr:hypothetical protein [Fodinibius roseus]SHE34385.1 Leucine-rich repeat (LRR) protein [Fodinibius roseus]
MKHRFPYFLVGFIILLTLVQCKNSITETETKSHLNKKIELIAPEIDSEQSTFPTFKWKKTEEVQTFQIQLSTDEDFATMNIDSIIDTTSFTPPNLQNDTTFHWKIRAKNSESEGPWSETWNFKTIGQNTKPEGDTLSDPFQIAPKDGASGTSLQTTFKWKAVDGADFYILHVSQADQMVVDEQVKGTTYTPKDELIPEETHHWRVRAVKDGNKGKWSEIKEFATAKKIDTLNAPSLISPEHKANNSSLKPTFEWEPVDGADYYILHASHTDQMVVEEEVKGTTYTPDNEFTPEAIHYWRVRAAKDKGKSLGNWSEIDEFTTTSQNSDNDNNSENNSTGDVSGDQDALMDLYEATGGDRWKNNSGWGNGDPSNAWHGVEVNAEGRVVRLELFGNGLNGRLPESIGNLTELKYLNIKQNALEGEIPSTIGNLRKVVYLLLSGVPEDPPTNPQHNIHQGKTDESGNTFTGVIPSTIGKLSNLEYIELSGSQVTGRIPPEIGNATNLKFIAFSWNPKLTGGIPATIGNLQNLVWLYVRASSLDGTIPEELGKVRSLRTIHLGYNDEHGGEGLHGVLPDLRNLTMLRNFNVDKNNLSGEWPHYWNNGKFDNLVSLRASWNDFSSDQIHGFENLSHLVVFTVTGSDINGTLPNSFKDMSNLKIFSLAWTNISGELPQSGYSGYRQLRQIRLNSTKLKGHIPAAFFEAAENDKLRRLFLSHNEFTSVDEEAMNSVSSPVLETIDVSNNNF